MHYLLIKRADGGLELNIHGFIGGWYSPKAADYKAALADAAASGEASITISIHSPGGDVMEGFAIYNAIKRCGLSVTTRVDGIAASMASIIMLAGERVEISRNALVMIHEPSTYTSGTSKEIRKAADTLEKVAALLVAEYVRRTGLPEEKIKEMLADETWMSPTDALELGFVDAVVDGEAVEDIDAWASLDWKGLCGRIAAEFAPGHKPENKNGKENSPKDMKAIAALVGLQPTATEAEIITAVTAVKARLELAENRLEAAAQAEAKRKDEEVDAVIAKAITEGRIVEAERPQMKLIANAGIDVLKGILAKINPVATLAGSLPAAGAGTPGDRSAWNLLRWMKEDPDGLAARAEADPNFIATLPK